MTGDRKAWIKKAEEHEENHDFDGAVEAYKKALKPEENSHHLHTRLGYCYEKTGNIAAAIEALIAATGYESCPPQWHVRLARLLARQGDHERANEKYRQAWRNAPTGRLALELGAAGWKELTFAAADNSGPAERGAISALERALQDGASEAEQIVLIERIDEATQPATFWLYLYAIFIRAGHALAALMAKRAAALRIMADAAVEATQSIGALETAAAAACYVGEYSIADALLGRSKWNPQDTLHIQLDILISQGRVGDTRALAEKVGIAPTNERFRDYLQGKSIAIVGPARNELHNGKAIDQHDVVVRTNFTGRAPLVANVQMLGSKTDISYYNTSFIELHEPETVDALRNAGLKWAIMRHGSMRRRMKVMVPNQRYRDWISYKKSEFIGISFAMRHILYEMAVLADSPISVYGADFFLGTDPHYSGYLGAGITVTYEYARHDPFDTFFLMKTLRAAGFIKPDEVLDEILGLSAEQFAARISQRFGTLPSRV